MKLPLSLEEIIWKGKPSEFFDKAVSDYEKGRREELLKLKHTKQKEVHSNDTQKGTDRS